MSVWGKIIGGTAGFALGGPIGAMLGVMVGGTFDRTAKRFKNSNQIVTKSHKNYKTLLLASFSFLLGILSINHVSEFLYFNF